MRAARRRPTVGAPGTRAAGAVALALTLAAGTGAGVAAGTPGVADRVPRVSSLSSAFDWPVYHHDPLGSGVDTSGVSFSPAAPAWTTAPVDGQIYGEPLAATGRVFAATENDTVFAFAADSGGPLWSTHVGTSVPGGDLPCGDIGPTVGITSTPVLDVARGEIFVVADELLGGGPVHVLVGLSLYTGAVLLSEDVDPAGSYPPALLQRASLTLDNGNVVFGFGGNEGDCSTYHGWVVSAPEGGGTPSYFEVDGTAPGEGQGAVWMGGAAPIVDGSGNIWVAAGNGSVTNPSGPYDNSDSVLELSPSLQLAQYFAPTTWASDNGSDLDLGSSSPALLANGTVLQEGKSRTAYLLARSRLGGIGGQLVQTHVCGSDVDGGNAVVGSVVYSPCEAGVEALSVGTSPPSVTVDWQTPTRSGGPPIVAGGLVWTIDRSGTLFGLDPASGGAVQQFAIGPVANHFPTPSVGEGLLLAPSADQVHAFSGSAGIPGPPAAAPPVPPHASYWEVAWDGGIFSFGNASFYGSMGGRPLVAPIVTMAPTPDGGGYWEVAADGGVFSFGDASFFGSMGGRPLVAPIVTMAPTPDGGGYWEVAADGGVFSFGDAHFFGSMGGRPLNAPVVGLAATADGAGYWEVASDGGLFGFGDAVFYGSMGGRPLTRPVVAMTVTADGAGYWEVASDGGIFGFGDAVFYGSMGGQPLARPVVGMASTADRNGYWLVASDGGIFSFGDALFSGSMGGVPLVAPVVGIAALPGD